ncbi:EF-hand domain-containing protein [Sphingomonas sp. RB1R13]|uniref:EF-hand domain-containing protein n=1 Tax=Sphingomonas sp. RB1R13 TaxID=3096159 RepID=UPI002FC6475B
MSFPPLSLMAAALLAAAAPALAHAHARDGATPPDMTRAQALERADSLFAQFDANHDGLVTREEARSVGGKLLLRRAALHRDVAPGIGGHTLDYMKRSFATAQSVTRPQFEAAMLAHFDEMDVNHDGILTAAERADASRHAPRPAEG